MDLETEVKVKEDRARHGDRDILKNRHIDGDRQERHTFQAWARNVRAGAWRVHTKGTHR